MGGIKRRDLISQTRYFPIYHPLILSQDRWFFEFASMAPALYSTQKKEFTTEINGLLRSEHDKLYKVIGQVFTRFIPSFELILGKPLRDNAKYEQLAVVIKISQFDMESACSYKGNWHSEGASGDEIVAVGLYYFDVRNGENICFDEGNHYLEIAKKAKHTFFRHKRRI